MKKIFLSTLAVFILSTQVLCAFSSNRQLPEPEEEVQVANVVDGDTVKLRDGRIVRLIGVDCPEVYDENVNTLNAARLDMSMSKQADYAVKAHDYLKGLIQKKSVRLSFDPAYSVLKHQDRGGRLLAYIFAEDELVNAELIKRGYCTIHPRVTFSRRKEFKEYEKEAREARTGIWKKSENIF